MLSIKEINRLALPAIVYNIIEPLIGLVDTAVIGDMPPEIATEAQGGVGLAAGLISAMIWGLAQIRTAVSSIVSQNLTEEKQAKIKTLVPQSLLFTFFIGIIIGGILAVTYTPLAKAIFNENNPIILNFSNDYFTIRSWGLPLALGTACMFGIFRGLQNTSYAMIAGIVGALTNILLDLILVNGFKGIPPMGVQGVAWASVIAQFNMLMVCFYFYFKKTPFNFNIGKKMNHLFGKVISISGNMFLRTLALNLSFILALRFASSEGEFALAAYSIAIQIWLFTSFFIDGYSNAGNALAGKYFGTKDISTLNLLSKKLLKINVIIASILSCIYLLSYSIIPMIFTDDQKVIEVFNTFFWLVIIAQPLNAIAFTFDGIYKGLGYAKTLRNTLFVATFVVFIPILFLFDLINFGIFAVWFAFIGWMAYRGLSLWFDFQRSFLQSKNI